MAITDAPESIDHVIGDAVRSSPFRTDVCRCKNIPSPAAAVWKLSSVEEGEQLTAELFRTETKLRASIPFGTSLQVAIGMLNVQERRAADAFLAKQSKVVGFFDVSMRDLLVTVRGEWKATLDKTENVWQCDRLVSFAVLA